MGSLSFNLTLVRHGQAEKNLEGGILHGSTESPLTELGCAQAAKVGERLKDEKYDLVYSSDLSRAYDTCLAIVGDPNRIIKDTTLREKDFGKFEGQPNKYFKEELEKTRSEGQSWSEAFYQFEESTMETYEQVETRTKTFLSELIKNLVSDGNDGVGVLVAAHGLVIRGFVLHIMKDFKNDLPPLNEFQYQHCPNTGVTKVKFCVDRESGAITQVTKDCLYCDKHLSISQMSASFHEKK